MFDIINLLIGVTFLVFIASVVVIAVGSICYLTAYIKEESGWVSCLCTVIGFGGIAFLTLGVPLWGPFIPGTTTGTVLGFFGWTNLMFVFGTMRAVGEKAHAQRSHASPSQLQVTTTVSLDQRLIDPGMH